jgi:F-type H+-transporting ATPase subunit b
VSPTAATFLFEAGNFLALAALLGWVLFRPVQNAIERRRAALDAEGREAAQKMADAERQVAELTAQRRELDASLDRVRTEARRQAEAEAQRIVESARAAVRREQEHLKATLAARRRQEARTASYDAAAAARSVVVQLLERVGGPDLDLALVGAACAELHALAARGALAPVLIEAPHDLDERMRARIAEAARCAPASLQERIVPDLVGGVRVITAAGLVDASVAGLASVAERVLLERIDAEEHGGG